MEAGLINWLRIGVLGIIWGSSFMAVSVAITGFGPITVAAGRILIGAIILLGLLRIMGLSLPSLKGSEGRKIWLAAFGFGVLTMALPFFLLSWGQLYVASGFAGVTMAAVPLLVLPLAHLLIPGEKLTAQKTLGFVIGFAGVIVLIGLDAFKSSGLGLEPLARLACFGAAACYAFGGIITKLAPKTNPFAFATAATMLAAIIIVPAAIMLEGMPAAWPTSPLIAVVFLGVVPTAAANILLVSVIRSAGPSFLSLVNYQVPIWSVIFGSLFLSEVLPARTFWALGLIMLGLAVNQRWKRKKPAPSTAA
ncbi:membrane protein [Marinosulfonomonas sp. PRT-SC04]|nr:membrane protein [Marinosulfonomonas sp. PRT-SC04]